MKAFFDTSVLVAVFWEDHPRHQASLDLFYDARKKEAACAVHTLAEVYAVMTRLPVRTVLTNANSSPSSRTTMMPKGLALKRLETINTL